jgi:hypothetical protein
MPKKNSLGSAITGILGIPGEIVKATGLDQTAELVMDSTNERGQLSVSHLLDIGGVRTARKQMRETAQQMQEMQFKQAQASLINSEIRALLGRQEILDQPRQLAEQQAAEARRVAAEERALSADERAAAAEARAQERFDYEQQVRPTVEQRQAEFDLRQDQLEVSRKEADLRSKRLDLEEKALAQRGEETAAKQQAEAFERAEDYANLSPQRRDSLVGQAMARGMTAQEAYGQGFPADAPPVYNQYARQYAQLTGTSIEEAQGVLYTQTPEEASKTIQNLLSTSASQQRTDALKRKFRKDFPPQENVRDNIATDAQKKGLERAINNELSSLVGATRLNTETGVVEKARRGSGELGFTRSEIAVLPAARSAGRRFLGKTSNSVAATFHAEDIFLLNLPGRPRYDLLGNVPGDKLKTRDNWINDEYLGDSTGRGPIDDEAAQHILYNMARTVDRVRTIWEAVENIEPEATTVDGAFIRPGSEPYVDLWIESVNTIPGWKMYKNSQGRIEIDVPPGEEHLVAQMQKIIQGGSHIPTLPSRAKQVRRPNRSKKKGD